MEETRYSPARDAFVYLLSYFTLIIASVSFNFLLKTLVGRLAPDPMEPGFLSNDMTVIGFLAAVILAFPVFFYLNYLANRLLGQERMKYNSGVRLWLIYLTLVAVILIILWQLIALLITFLNGTLAIRFLLYTGITLLIALAVLGYQWWHLKFFDGTAKRIGLGFRIFEWLVVVVVAGAVVWGFAAIDPPAVQRAKRLDSVRVERLSMIRGGMQNFYGWKGESAGHKRLPKDLDELIRDGRVSLSSDAILDPVTKEKFGYQILSKTKYKLGANFLTEWTEATVKQQSRLKGALPGPIEGKQQVFYHPKGEEWFELEVQ